MKLNISFLSLGFIFILGCAQEIEPAKAINTTHIILDCGGKPLAKETSPLLILFKNNKSIIINNDSIEVINPNWIESISVVKNPQSVIDYGKKGKYGAILIHFKESDYKYFPEWLTKEFSAAK